MVELLKGLVFRLTMQWWFMLTIGGGIFLARVHDRSKHIEIQYQYTRCPVRSGKIALEYLPMKEMLADLVTKPLPRVQHQYSARGIGVL